MKKNAFDNSDRITDAEIDVRSNKQTNRKAIKETDRRKQTQESESERHRNKIYVKLNTKTE